MWVGVVFYDDGFEAFELTKWVGEDVMATTTLLEGFGPFYGFAGEWWVVVVEVTERALCYH